MFNCFETSTTGRRDWVTCAFLLLAGAGFAGVLATSSSEAEVEFFGEGEIEECLIVALQQKSGHRADRPKRHTQSPTSVSRTQHAEISREQMISGHRLRNGLLAPIRC